MKTIGIVGTRRRNSQEDFLEIEKMFLRFYEIGDTICSGLCPLGADRFAVILQEKYNTKYIWFPGYGDKYAKFERNTSIAQRSDILIARVHPDRKGGTEDCIHKWKRFHKKSGFLYLIHDRIEIFEY